MPGVPRVLRSLVRPGVNPGLALLFDFLVVQTRLARGKSRRSAAELRGMDGAINYAFTGEGGGAWHVLVRDGRVFVRRGHHPAPLATVELSVEELFRQLTGHSSSFVAQMAGRVRVRGEGPGAMAVSTLVGELRLGREAKGAEGRVARAVTGLALRLSGFDLEWK